MSSGQTSTSAHRRTPAFVWGYNNAGGLGLGHTARVYDPVPGRLPEGTVDVQGGVDFTVALTNSGTVLAWGGNEFGQLGDGTTQARRTPAPVALPGNAKAAAIAAGTDHVVVLTRDGKVLAWGRNHRGQVGDSSTVDQLTPQVVCDGGVVSLGAGDAISAAVTRDGGLLTWGRNGAGQLGATPLAGGDVTVPSPAELPGGTVAAAVYAGRRHLVVRTRWGQVLMFGVDAQGRPVHAQVPLDRDWGEVRTVQAGDDFTLALTSRDVLLAWGANGSGQLGAGDLADRLSPVVVRLPHARGHVTAVHAGARSAVAVTSSSEVYAWGESALGQTGLGPGPDVTPTPQRVSRLDGVAVTGVHGGAHHVVLTVRPAQGAAPVRRDRRRRARPDAPAGRLTGPAPVRRLQGGTTPGQPTPYFVQASTELSEDHFLTDDVVIGADDQVMPFVNPFNDNAVEAIVFAQGTVAHLRRDPSASSGWTYEAVDLQDTLATVSNVAVAANGTDVYLLVFGTPNSSIGDAPAWITKLDGPDSWDTGGLATYTNLGCDPSSILAPIKGGVSAEGVCYFSTAVTNPAKQTTSIMGWVATGNWGDFAPLASQSYLTLDTSTHQVEDSIVFYDTAATDTTGYLLAYTSNGLLSVYQQQDKGFNPSPMTNAGASNVTALLWAWATPDSTTGTPGYAFQQQTGTVLVDEAGNVNTLSDQASVGQNQVTVWLQDGLYTVNLIDGNGTVNLVQETSATGTGTWAPALPLTPGLAAIYSVPTDPSEATLFAVGLDETLSVLTLDASGWTQTQVHQDGATLQEIDSYRVQASMLDANGNGIAQGQVLISTDRPVGFWQASGNTVVTPAAPVTMTADLKGEITFNVPAEELDCAVLTVQALDPDGNPSGDPFAVTPDTDVSNFLGGTGSLTDIGPLTPGALLSARNADGTPLAPTLTNLPSDQQQQAATASTGALKQLITAGTTAAPSGPNAVQSFKLDLSSGVPTFVTSTDSNAYGSLTAALDLDFSFSHLFDSIGHALRHAAMKLKTAVVAWSEDAGSWLVNLAVTIGDDVVNFANLAISDIKDAFHVIGGFFQALGADIKAAIAWLKHNVLELLREAGQNAATIQGWLQQAPAELTTVITGIDISAKNFFSSKEQQAHQLIQYLETQVEDETFGSAAPLPPPTDDSGSAGTQNALLKDLGLIGKVMNDMPGKWLMDKLLSYLPVTDTGPQVSPDTFAPLVDDLTQVWEDVVDLSQSLITLIEATAQDSLATKEQVTQMEMTAWFAALDQTVHDLLQLADAIADLVLQLVIAGISAIGTYFSYQYQVLGRTSILGLILDEAGIDPTLSLDHLVSLVVAYPATLIGRILGHDSLFPAATQAVGDGPQALGDGPQAPGAAADSYQVGLGICGAVAQGVWGMADLVGDLQSFTDASGKRGSPSGVIDYFDILCPVAETVLLWPSKSFPDGSTAYPFYGGIADNTTDWELLPPIILTAIQPSVFGILTKMGWTTPAPGEFPSGVEDVVKDYMGPVVQMLAGIINTALGAAYSAKNDSGGAAIAGGVLGNLSFVLAPLATKWMNETTEDVPVLIKTAVDAVGNIGAAICIAESASLPPK